MLYTSTQYKKLIKESGRIFRAEIIVTFSDGSTAELTDKDIMQDSLSIVTGCTDEGSFSVGNAIIGQLSFDIDNSSGSYDNMSFEDAGFNVRIGLVIGQRYDETNTVEWLRKGVFTAEEVTVNERYISITAFDNMSKLDKPFGGSGIRFPLSLGGLFRQVCTYCGVPYSVGNFPNSTLMITANEIDDGASCRDVISYIAQLACRFAKADANGTITLAWYSSSDYTIGEKQRINGTVTVSGVMLTDTSDEQSIIGTNEYCIAIESNPLAQSGAALQDPVWDGLIGMELTPFSAELISDPSLEAGDIVTVSDIRGNTFLTPVTNTTYRLDGKMSVSCDAETVKEKQRTSCSPSAKIIAQASRRMDKKISEYDIRAKQFAQIAANAMGFYQTDETQSDGSTITYLHDKPAMSDSATIWKKSVDGFFVSTDGGQTYTAGIDSSGNAVLNLLAAKGIIADWIRAGILSDQNGTTSINLSDGKITISLSDNNKLVIWTNGLAVYDSSNRQIAGIYAGSDSSGNVTRGNIRCGDLRLIDGSGTKTTSLYLAGRSIPCRFKLVDPDGDADLRERVVRILSPLIEGELEVQTENATYTIKCRPTEMSVFKRTDVFYVWSWETTFYADYPLWQRGSIMHEAKTVMSSNVTVYSSSGVEVPLRIRFYESAYFQNVTQQTRIGFQSFPQGTQWIEVDTRTYAVTDNLGNDRSNCIDPDYNIGTVRLLPGNNVIFCTAGTGKVLMMWHDYALGVI